MSSREIDAVLFDLDDTICEYCRTGEELLEAAFAAAEVDPLFTAEEYYARYDAYLDDSTEIADLREACFRDLATDAGTDPALGTRVADAYEAARDYRNVRFLPGAKAALSTLADEYRLGMVTNGSPSMQRKKLDALGIEAVFDAIVFAGYDAPRKPDPAPFRLVLDRLDATPDRAVHVGNSLDTDVAGARAAGIASVWIPITEETDGHVRPDFELDSLADLAPALRETDR